MSGYIDNSKYKQMIANRPLLSILPSVKPKVYSQYLGLNWYALIVVSSILGIAAYKQSNDLTSMKTYNTRKNFSFEADPYSSKVSCSFKDAPYTQQKFWNDQYKNHKLFQWRRFY